MKCKCGANRKEIKISIYRWLRINKYPKGFRTLCHNCNMSYGFYGYCPHQTLPNSSPSSLALS